MDDNFINNQQFIKNIPSISDVAFVPIHKKQMYVRILNALIFGLLLVGAAIGINYADSDFILENKWIFYLIFLIIFVITMVFAILGFYKMKYAIRDHDVIYQKGLLWRNTTIVPFNRVQHCEVKQGPLQRLLGLSSIKLYTAGGSSSDLSVTGLLHEEAERMRDFIIKKTGIDEEE